MTKTIKAFLLLWILLAFVSCDFIRNTSTYEDTTKGFIESLIAEDYEEGLNYMALEHDGFKNTNIDTLKSGIKRFRDIVVENFGKELDYKLMTSSKTFSTTPGESTAPNTTKALVQYSNEKEFGVFELLFDDNSNKILKIDIQDIKEPIPNMLGFWLFGIIAICVPIFNIWVIRKIKKSDLKKKWLKYIAVILLNVPSLTFSAVGGLTFKLLSFQFLLGIGFGYMGYLSSTWTFGMPLGGLYWLWKLKQKKEEEINAVPE